MRIKSLLLLPIALVTLTGCARPNVTSTYEIYSDIPSFSDGDYDFYFTPIKDKVKKDVHNISFSMLLVYSGQSSVSLRFYDPIFTNEISGKQIYAEGYKVLRYQLTPDSYQIVDFTCELSAPLSQEHQNFSFQYLDKQLVFHLYERPDDVRTKYDVTFELSDGTKEVRKIPEGRSPIDYPWVSLDNLRSARAFYSDEEMTEKVDSEFVITGPTTLYCDPEQILNFTAIDETTYAVSKVNFVPTNGEIVFPKTFDGKKVTKINEYVTNGLKRLNVVYIPKYTEIAENNFTHRALSIIHFEGSEDEWKAINKSPVSEDVEMIYFSYKV